MSGANFKAKFVVPQIQLLGNSGLTDPNLPDSTKYPSGTFNILYTTVKNIPGCNTGGNSAPTTCYDTEILQAVVTSVSSAP